MNQKNGTMACLQLASIAIAILLSAAWLGYSLMKSVSIFKDSERFVSVRGLAERDVEANLAIWSLSWTSASNDLQVLSESLATQSEQIQSYLKRQGLKPEEIEAQPTGIRDLKADIYNQQQINFRYSAKGNLAIKTNNIVAVKKALANMDEILKLGIVFGENGYISPPEYSYTDLNKVKPEMIASATRNARDAAQKFAADSESRLGKIKRATQGLFEIFARDALSPEKKTVRVVTTVEYSLED